VIVAGSDSVIYGSQKSKICGSVPSSLWAVVSTISPTLSPGSIISNTTGETGIGVTVGGIGVGVAVGEAGIGVTVGGMDVGAAVGGVGMGVVHATNTRVTASAMSIERFIITLLSSADD
jgi:hypothetical protein